MNDFELSLLYGRLDSLVESGEVTEEEATEELRYILDEQMERRTDERNKIVL